MLHARELDTRRLPGRCRSLSGVGALAVLGVERDRRVVIAGARQAAPALEPRRRLGAVDGERGGRLAGAPPREDPHAMHLGRDLKAIEDGVVEGRGPFGRHARRVERDRVRRMHEHAHGSVVLQLARAGCS